VRESSHSAAVLQDVGHGCRLGSNGFSVEAHAGSDGLSVPKEADVRQQLIFADAAFQLSIHPAPHLLNDPGQQACTAVTFIIA